MSNITEWLANLSWQTVVIIIVCLVALRYALSKQGTAAAKSAAEIAESLAIAMGLVFLIIRPFFVQAFFIPSPSMFPTLRGDADVQDHILVNKTVYRIRDPRAGEIVVFRAPKEALEGGGQFGADGGPGAKQTDFIKRVIGVPGDEIYVVPGYILVNGVKWTHASLDDSFGPGARVRLKRDGIYLDGERLSQKELADTFGRGAKIEIHAGYVVRNGRPLDESYLAEDPDTAYPDPDDPDLRKFANEGKLILREDGGLPRVRIPRGKFLMMGDNRNNSRDSRVWGPLDRNRVVGRAMFIFWPLSRIRWLR